MSKKSAGKVGRPATTRERVLLALKETPGMTAKELGVSTAYMITLTQGDRPLVTRSGTVKTSEHAQGRGRPSVQFKLGSGGGLVAANLAKKAAKADAETEIVSDEVAVAA